MAAALVERALEDLIRSRLHDPGNGAQDEWFEGSNAPFRTFSAKITLGRALDLYDEHIEGYLATIKSIRNAFAHGMIPLSFDHPALDEECSKLKPKSVTVEGLTPRLIFAISCLTLARQLGMKPILKDYLKPTRVESGAK